MSSTPPLPELLLEAVGDLERAAVDADVLAEHEHRAGRGRISCRRPSLIAWR
jgi:hypothetical protein